MRTILRSLMSFALLIALSGIANATPPTQLVGSWICEEDGSVAFLMSVNQGGTVTGSDTSLFSSGSYGVWQRTGRKTFDATVSAFYYDTDGNAEYILTSDTSITMSDNDNLTADLVITISDLDGSVVGTESASVNCTRIQVGF